MQFKIHLASCFALPSHFPPFHCLLQKSLEVPHINIALIDLPPSSGFQIHVSVVPLAAGSAALGWVSDGSTEDVQGSNGQSCKVTEKTGGEIMERLYITGSGTKQRFITSLRPAGSSEHPPIWEENGLTKI